MNNVDEFYRRLKDAQACLKGAERNFTLKDYRTSIQNSQLSIEISTKAVIAYFTEPLWQHDPSEQLLLLLKKHSRKIRGKFYAGITKDFAKLAKAAKSAASWHAWSTYGKEKEDGTWIPAVELCKKDIAQKLLKSAKNSFQITQKFSQFIPTR